MIKSLSFKKGYTLIEAVIYIAVFVIISLTIMSLILSVLETSRQVSPVNSISRAAASALEVITREIRGATDVDALNSDLGVTSGSLQLNTVDKDDNPRVVSFYLEDNTIKIKENDVYLGPLSSTNVSITELIFSLATSTKTNLVKVEIGLTAGDGKYKKSDRFYSSVQLRTDN